MEMGLLILLLGVYLGGSGLGGSVNRYFRFGVFKIGRLY